MLYSLCGETAEVGGMRPEASRPCGNKRCVEESPESALSAQESLIFHAWALVPHGRRPKREEQLRLRKAPKKVLGRLARMRSGVTLGISIARGFLDDDSLWVCGTLRSEDAIAEACANTCAMLMTLGISPQCAQCITKRAFMAVDFDDDCDE